MVTECKFVPAAALDGLAANVATLLEWSRLQDNDGIGFFLITNGAVYIDNIAPTVCCTNHDAVRYARHELKQLKLRGFSGLLEFIADDDQSPTADDFAQVVAVHKSVKLHTLTYLHINSEILSDLRLNVSSSYRILPIL